MSQTKGAVTYHRIALTDAERTEKNTKKSLSDGESRLGGDEGRRGRRKERIKRMGNAYVPDKERQLTDIAVRVTYI